MAEELKADDLTADELTVREVTRKTWRDMEGLFESPGGPKRCWCMIYRADREEAERTDGASRKAAMAARIEAGVPVGLLGYVRREPVAWCSIAPRPTFGRLGVPSQDDGPERVWSVSCFFLKRPLRGRGLTRTLLDAAVDHAAQRGATTVEAYAVDPESPSYRFMGFVPMFESAGFHRVGTVGKRRVVMRRDVRG